MDFDPKRYVDFTEEQLEIIYAGTRSVLAVLKLPLPLMRRGSQTESNYNRKRFHRKPNTLSKRSRYYDDPDGK